MQNKRVSIWLTASSPPQLKSLSTPHDQVNSTMHIVLVTSTVASACDIEKLVESLKKCSASLSYKTLTAKPPVGASPAPFIDESKTRVLLPLASNVELDNLHELVSQLMPPEESWEPKLVLCQGNGVPSLLSKITEDVDLANLEFEIDQIEVTVSGCCNKCHNTIMIGKNPLGSNWFFRTANYINGMWSDAKKNNMMAVHNPATGKVFHYVPEASEDDVSTAVKSAKEAFVSWSSMNPSTRSNYLVAIADVVEKRKEYLAKMEVLDNGKPLKEALIDIQDVANCFRYYAKLALKINHSSGDDDIGNKIDSIPDPSFEVRVRKEPIGVCALICSFNYPLLIATWKIAPCLASGSTCIVKPSDLTPMTALELGAIAMEVGLPAGVLNVLTGLGSTTGNFLVSNPDVDKISFTGSVATGSHVMQVASKRVANVTLELGGKSPLIICRDTQPESIDAIIDWIMIGIFFNSGQVCSATSRVMVHKDLYKPFLEKLASQAKKIIIGDGMDEETQMGPLVSEFQQRKVLDYIARGKSEGAKIVCGGSIDPRIHGTGYFVEPTIFADVKPWMKIWKEEIFGPVLCVTSFETEAEAISLSNDSTYGLAGAVFSSDPDTCSRIAKSLRCGIVWINCSQPAFIQAPWGGYKKSGIGRELGPWGLANFLETKQITSWVDKKSPGWDWYQSSKL